MKASDKQLAIIQENYMFSMFGSPYGPPGFCDECLSAIFLQAETEVEYPVKAPEIINEQKGIQ